MQPSRHGPNDRAILPWLLPALLVFLALACTTVSNALPANVTATAGAAGTRAAAAATATQAFAQTAEQATQSALETEAESTARAVADASQTVEAEARASATAAIQATGTAKMTATRAAANTRGAANSTQNARETSEANKTATAEVRAEATAQTRAFKQTIEALNRDGYLGSSDGRYHRLENFFISWAQINYYQWLATGYSPEEFVIRADASWNSASESANWFNSGCGFVFSEDGIYNHHLAYLGLDGYVYVYRIHDGEFYGIARAYYGVPDVPKGRAEIMLIVEGGRISFFVDGVKVLRAADSTYGEGVLGLTLLSGTNKSYGTRCSMENIDLWVIR